MIDRVLADCHEKYFRPNHFEDRRLLIRGWLFANDKFYAVRISCLEEVDVAELMNAPITYYDANSDNYESPPAEIRRMLVGPSND